MNPFANVPCEPSKRSMTIKLRRNQAHTLRAPQLKGWVAVQLHDAQELVRRAESSEKNCVFLSVALWENQAGNEYAFGGTVSTEEPRNTIDKAPPANVNNPWY